MKKAWRTGSRDIAARIRRWCGVLNVLGCKMHVPEGYRIPHLNTPRVPEGVDDAKVRKHLLEQARYRDRGRVRSAGRQDLPHRIDGADGERGLRRDVPRQIRGSASGGRMSTMRVAATFGTRATEARIAPYERALREAGIEPVRNPESLTPWTVCCSPAAAISIRCTMGRSASGNRDTPDDERDVLELRLVQEALWRPIFQCSRFAVGSKC